MKYKNTYSVIRHGESESNIRGIIVSHPKNGIPRYGLTLKGKEQVRKSIKQAKQKELLNKSTIILSSPFKRAKETAEIAGEILGIKEVIYNEKLIERNFGDLEGKIFDYNIVWNEDAKNPKNTLYNVESVHAMHERMFSLIEDLEKIYNNKAFLLVSHGDPLHVLHAGFKDTSLKTYRKIIPYIDNAEIRRLFTV